MRPQTLGRELVFQKHWHTLDNQFRTLEDAASISARSRPNCGAARHLLRLIRGKAGFGDAAVFSAQIRTGSEFDSSPSRSVSSGRRKPLEYDSIGDRLLRRTDQ
jgi:hypothetical protein